MTRYLDHAATTPVDPRVVEAMLPYFTEHFGNPNSLYGIGREAYQALEAARKTIAGHIGVANPAEIVFTSGGTESDNAAMFGIMQRVAPEGGHLIVSAYEHPAILEVAHQLEKRGHTLTVVKPRRDGHVYAEDVAAAMQPDTKLVSVMYANNEIGAVNDIAAIAKVAHEGGAVFHTDAVQALGKVRMNLDEAGVDLASFSAHKIYGPRGVGALYVRRGTRWEPLMYGGGQESRRRSGTQNVAGAVGFAKALDLMMEDFDAESARLAALRDRVIAGITSRLENTEPSMETGERLSNIAPLLIKGVEGEAMLLQLDMKGFSISTGSACSSGSLEPSHVLLSIGVPQEVAHGSLRVSVGRWTTEQDVDDFVEALIPVVETYRKMSPVYERMFCQPRDN